MGLTYIPQTKPCMVCGESFTARSGRAEYCDDCRVDVHRRRQRESARRRHSQKYGISPEQYAEMLDRQRGLCPICGRHYSTVKRAFHVDHCHKTGVVRALLCGQCNPGLGNFGDSITRLESAIAYLRTHQP